MYIKFKNEIKEAMKNKDTLKKDCLRMVVDKAKSIKKEKYPNETLDIMPDEYIIQAIQKEIKQLNQTKDALKGNELCDLYKETVSKIDILNEYLPRQMTREEVEKAVHEILDNNDYVNFGMAMKLVMSQLRGKADNKLIKEVVESM